MRSILVVDPKGGCGETAERGVGFFDMGPVAVAEDLEQWRPLINRIEGKKVKTR